MHFYSLEQVPPRPRLLTKRRCAGVPPAQRAHSPVPSSSHNLSRCNEKVAGGVRSQAGAGRAAKRPNQTQRWVRRAERSGSRAALWPWRGAGGRESADCLSRPWWRCNSLPPTPFRSPCSLAGPGSCALASPRGPRPSPAGASAASGAILLCAPPSTL